MPELDLSHLDHPVFETIRAMRDPDGAGTKVIEMPHDFKARDYQVPVWEALFRDEVSRLVLVWHRRAGKDRTCFNLCACASAATQGNYLYCFPTYAQGRKVMWDGIGKDEDGSGYRYIEHIPERLAKRNKQEMKFEFHDSGSIMQIVGTDQIDLLRGTNPRGVVFSEYQQCNPLAWDTIRPILTENGGWAIFNWTPKGKNHAYRMEQMAKKNKKWFFSKLDVGDTVRPDGSPVISEEDIQDERDSGMSEDMVLQEFWLSYEAGNPGAYYGKEIREAYSSGRICFIPIEKGVDVHTFWDLGVSDYMAIWFVQAVGREIRLINYYQNTGYSLPHYADYLRKFATDASIQYGEHWAPHDIEVRELVGDTSDARAKTRKERAKELGISFKVAPKIKNQAEGIEAVRRILPACWFNEDMVTNGLAALQEYAPKYDNKKRVFLDYPDHNWASHGAKSLETMAQAWKDRLMRPRAKSDRRHGGQPQMNIEIGVLED